MSIQLCIRGRVFLIQGLDDMKRLYKQSFLILDNRGETISEVLVAFTLLTIMLVILTQGITAASRALINANDHRESADMSMIQLQQENLGIGAGVHVGNANIYRHVKSVFYNGREYRYVVYTSSASEAENNTEGQ